MPPVTSHDFDVLKLLEQIARRTKLRLGQNNLLACLEFPFDPGVVDGQSGIPEHDRGNNGKASTITRSTMIAGCAKPQRQPT